MGEHAERMCGRIIKSRGPALGLQWRHLYFLLPSQSMLEEMRLEIVGGGLCVCEREAVIEQIQAPRKHFGPASKGPLVRHSADTGGEPCMCQAQL